eukprot:Gb_01750 [translate_table: standard]
MHDPSIRSRSIEWLLAARPPTKPPLIPDLSFGAPARVFPFPFVPTLLVETSDYVESSSDYVIRTLRESEGGRAFLIGVGSLSLSSDEKPTRLAESSEGTYHYTGGGGGGKEGPPAKAESEILPARGPLPSTNCSPPYEDPTFQKPPRYDAPIHSREPLHPPTGSCSSSTPPFHSPTRGYERSEAIGSMIRRYQRRHAYQGTDDASTTEALWVALYQCENLSEPKLRCDWKGGIRWLSPKTLGKEPSRRFYGALKEQHRRIAATAYIALYAGYYWQITINAARIGLHQMGKPFSPSLRCGVLPWFRAPP